jgi:hypothetical protein
MAAGVGLALLGAPATSRAVFEISISAGGPAVVIVDNMPGDSDPTLGSIVAVVPIGPFVADVQIGTSKPLIGGPTVAAMDLGSSVTSSGAGTLTVLLSDTDFTFPGSNPHFVVATSTTSGSPLPATASFTWQSFFDPANVDFGMGGLSTPVQTGFNTVSTSGFLNAPFSITEKLVITTTGRAFVSLDNMADATPAAPEPTGIVMALIAIPTLAGSWLRRRAKSA